MTGGFGRLFLFRINAMKKLGILLSATVGMVAANVTKAVNAKPMTRQEYNDFRGWQLPENENGADEGYLVEYQDGEPNTAEYQGYVLWLPKEQFENSYQYPSVGMSFGHAVELLKGGHRVARSGWNGKGMFLSLVKGRDTDYHVNSEVFGTGNDGNSQYQLPVLDAIYMKTADNKLVPWLASQTDVLAEDWQIVEK